MSPNERRDRDLLRDRYYAGFEGAVTSGVAAALIIVVAFWNQSDRVGLLGWGGVILLAVIPAVAVKYKSEALRFGTWLRCAYAVEVVHGVAWGMLAIVAMPAEAVGQAVVCALLAMVLMAGSVSSSQFTLAFMSFSLPLVATTIVGIVLHGAPGTTPLIWLTLVVWFFGSSVAKDQRALQLELIGAVQSNEDLVANLEAGNAALDRAKRRADALARTDQLTNLPNRHSFEEEIERRLTALTAETCESLTVAFFDLDRFKEVNDRLGHRAGDVLLKAIASRLLKSLRDGETCARLGGDELVILATNADPDEIGARLLLLFSDPVIIEGCSLDVSASIGIATVTDPVAKDDLMSRADAAQYTAKYAGGNSYVVWAESALIPAK